MSKTSQSKRSFKDKWELNQDLAFAETLKEGSDIFNWILHRNGWDGPDSLRSFLAGKRRILDAGCGNGRVTALLRRHSPPETTHITGIDVVAAEVARRNLAEYKNIDVFSKDLMNDLQELGRFDFIYCQEVLHHTADPRAAFLNLCRLLSDDGEIAVYVYKKKAPIREFADDFVRDHISELPYEQAIEAMQEITELGRNLSDLDTKVRVPEVKVLGIEAGEYEIQRFIYHFFLKCFWNPSLRFKDNVAINYDWYHPQLCTRHTLPEVESWFEEAGLKIVHRFVDHYGITVRGVKSL